jgi:hypothetical protein
MIVHFKAANGVSGPATLEVNGLGTKSLQKEGSASLVNGDIVSGQMVSAIYDGTKFQMLSAPLNPSAPSPPPTENVLVYAETLAADPSTSLATLALPGFTFDSGKNYLLEMRVTSYSNAAGSMKVELSDGSTDYVFPGPGAGDVVQPRPQYNETPRYSKLLPNLSGAHTIEVQASRMGAVEIKIYEVYDNLVYADFAPYNLTTTVVSKTLQSFTAQSGHTYLLTMTAHCSPTSAYTEAACYLSNGIDVEGLPYPDPTTELCRGIYTSGDLKLSKMITGISGSFDVITRYAEAGGINVEIHDIT